MKFFIPRLNPFSPLSFSLRLFRFVWFCLFLGGLSAGPLLATAPMPGGSSVTNDWLDYWHFDQTNSWATYSNRVPVAGTNAEVSLLGHGYAVRLDHTNGAWLRYLVVETNGTTNLTVDTGSVLFWFAPHWSSTNAGGTGPGQWGRLLEVGHYTTNASDGWWSLYFNDAGTQLHFSSQTNNGLEQTHLSAPIAWTSNRFHLIALTYSPTNSALYLDGALVTNGWPVTHLPPADARTNGFSLGGAATTGARGTFDDLTTYYPDGGIEYTLLSSF